MRTSAALPRLYIMQGGRGAGKTHKTYELALEAVKRGDQVQVVQTLGAAAIILEDPDGPKADLVIVDPQGSMGFFTSVWERVHLEGADRAPWTEFPGRD